MTGSDIKEEFDMYVHNAGLTDFVSDKCVQFYNLTDMSVRKFGYVPHRNSHYVIFNLYENSFHMNLEEFSEVCKIPYWGTCT